MRKRLLPMFLVCCLLAAWLSAYAQADNIVAKGDCGADGSNVKWTLDSSGHLSITGSGAIRDYKRNFYNSDDWGTSYSDAPWYDREATTAPYYENHNQITSLVIGEGVTCIGENAFLGLKALTKVTLPNSLTRIKECAFHRCTSLTRIEFPKGVTSIEAGVLFYCSNLLSFTISDTVTSIEGSAFRNCDHLTRITVPKSVEFLGSHTFRDCDKLQSVTILGEIPLIKGTTFTNCPALTEVTIPGSVEIIEKYAFSGCEALKDVYFTGSESMWKQISVDGENTPLESANIHYDTSIEATYRINALSVSDTDGKPLTAIPKSSCLVTVSVTNRASGATPTVFLASYDATGKYQGMMYATVEESVGATAKITLPVDNSAGNVAQFKAFAVKSFSQLEPIGDPVSFPAK